MSERKTRMIWEGNITCPGCESENHVKIQKEITTPAEPAEFNIIVSVEKVGKQSVLA